MMQNSPQQVLCLPRSPYGYAACEAYWILLSCCLNLTTRPVSVGASCEGVCYRLMSDAASDWTWATCLELQVIYSFCFPLLGLDAHEKDHAVFHGQLSSMLGLVSCQQNSQGILNFFSTFLCLPAAS